MSFLFVASLANSKVGCHDLSFMTSTINAIFLLHHVSVACTPGIIIELLFSFYSRTIMFF